MTERTRVSLATLTEKAPEAAEFMRQFSNANRLMLLCQIAQQESSVSDIQEALGIKQPALSQQLAELRQSGLVKTRRASRQIYYSIADGRAEAVMNLLFQLFCGAGLASVAASIDAPTAGADEPGLRVHPTSQGDAAHFARIESAE